MNRNKLIEILDPQAGTVRETMLGADESAIADKVGLGLQRLSEVANNTSQFPYLLQDGLRTILFDAYNEYAAVYPEIAATISSNKPYETWAEGSMFGKAPKVAEGAVFPRAEINIDRSKQVQNDKFGYILPVTWEMIHYDQTNIINQATRDLGGSMAYTKEHEFFQVLTTATNYVRTAAAGDSIAGNTATATFGPDTLNTAVGVLRQMKDRKSGRYIGAGMSPLTLVCATELEFAAMQLILSPQMGGMGDSNAMIVYGGGTSNPFRGHINKIISSPFVSAEFRYGWGLYVPGKAIIHQQVLPLELTAASNLTDWNYHNQDVLEYKAREVFGFGMLNDRFAYFSDSVTAATLA